jgi:hypothetical protein
LQTFLCRAKEQRSAAKWRFLSPLACPAPVSINNAARYRTQDKCVANMRQVTCDNLVAVSKLRKFSPVSHLLMKIGENLLGERIKICHKRHASGEMKATKSQNAATVEQRDRRETHE